MTVTEVARNLLRFFFEVYRQDDLSTSWGALMTTVKCQDDSLLKDTLKQLVQRGAIEIYKFEGNKKVKASIEEFDGILFSGEFVIRKTHNARTYFEALMPKFDIGEKVFVWAEDDPLNIVDGIITGHSESGAPKVTLEGIHHQFKPGSMLHFAKTHPYVDQAIKWLDQHWKGQKACPVCRHDEWIVADQLLEMRAFRPYDDLPPVKKIPLLLITCDHCGHSLFFNAIRAGFIKTHPSKKNTTVQMSPQAPEVTK